MRFAGLVFTGAWGVTPGGQARRYLYQRLAEQMESALADGTVCPEITQPSDRARIEAEARKLAKTFRQKGAP